MRTIHVDVKGLTPLIMHSCKTVNPLHRLTTEIAAISAIRKKTEDDYKRLSDLEWEAGLYWDDTVGLYMPAENIEACAREGAKVRKQGAQVVKAFTVLELKNPIDIGEKLSFDELKNDYRFRDVRSMRVKQARVIRTRPHFENWSFSFDAIYAEDILDFASVVSAIQYAGQYIGLGDSRPKYGKFAAVVTEID